MKPIVFSVPQGCQKSYQNDHKEVEQILWNNLQDTRCVPKKMSLFIYNSYAKFIINYGLLAYGGSTKAI